MTPTITLEVSGMTCGSCVRHVTSALTKLDGVANVAVALREGLVHVAPAEPPSAERAALAAQLIAELDRAGYSAKLKAA